MGDIVGGIIGGIGSLIGGNEAANDEKKGAAQSLTGYNYLNSNPLIGQLQTNGQAQSAAEGATTGNINQLLTSNDTNNPAFQNYLKSTGYQFQLGQGEGAITGNAAAKGILNSGATAKALTGYGQGLASTTFNNYLTQLGSLAGLQGSQAGQGLTAAQTVGQAGTAGGIASGQLTAQAGQSLGTAFANGANVIGGGVQNSMNNGSVPNFFATAAQPPSTVVPY